MTETGSVTSLTAVDRNRNRPRPNALTAAATRLTKTQLKASRRPNKGDTERVKEVWEMYDLVGEQRFLAATLAGRMGQARLYIGKVDPDNPTADPERVEDDPTITSLVNGFGANPAQLSGFLTRAGINLFMPGDMWIIGVPTDLVIDGEVQPLAEGMEPGDFDLTRLDWHVCSTIEVTEDKDDGTITFPLRTGAKVKVDPERVLAIRCWRPHPADWSRADSPALSSLPVLRELVGLTMHVSAQVDSRLAGAGLLLVASSVRDAVMRNAGIEPDGDDDDPFTDALIEMMTTPISDRSSAAAVVPGVWTIPLEEGKSVTDYVSHLTFASPLDAEARQLREEAIRRLALGEDAPPELLLGVANMNHWGAWLVREDVITTHVEPPLAIVCDAATREFLWPVLERMGKSEEESRLYVIWYSVDHLIARPNQLAEARDLHSAGVISDAVLRDAAGYDDDDAPEGQDPAINLMLQMITRAPTLAVTPGIPELVRQIREAMAGEVPEPDEASPSGEGEEMPADGPPSEEGEPPALAASLDFEIPEGDYVGSGAE